MTIQYPNYIQEKLVDADGNITQAWSNQMQQSISYIQNNLSQEGFVVPNLSTTEINDITAADNARIGISGFPEPKLHGALYYDKDTTELKLNKDGTIVVVA